MYFAALIGILLVPFAPSSVCAFHIQLSGLVTEHFSGDPMRGVQVRLVKDSVERETVFTQRNGRYELYLERGYDYLIWFHQENMVTKFVRIDAREIPLFPDVPFYEMDLQMTLFRWIDGFDFSLLNEPVGLAEYKHSVRNMFWNVDYTTARRTALQRLMIAYERELAAIDKARRTERMKLRQRGRRGVVHF